ncbi:FGGY-family carbohydrate kinase [Chloroflexota bacterium]
MPDYAPSYILVHDVGTTGNKACLYQVSETLELISSHVVEYPVYILPDGGAEQKVDEWWEAITSSTSHVLKESGVDPADIKGMAFCAQMTAYIPVDKSGAALRNPMSYLDGRSTAQISRHLYTGLLRIDNMNLFKLLRFVRITGGGAASAKDSLWKYIWVRDNEPEIHAATHKWLDVKDYLVLRCTGEFTMGYDSANVTFLYDTRPGKLGWNEALCRTYDVDMDHLPKIVGATQMVGKLLSGPAGELGLRDGIPVYGGGGDLSMISLGSGGFEINDTHIYIGTSGWVVANIDKRMTDIGSLVAGVIGAMPGRYNYIAEQETSGTCLQWVRDHLVKDEIGVHLSERAIDNVEEAEISLYNLLNLAVAETKPGSGGVIFTPWMHGNRSPFEDPYVRGMYFNISLDTGKRHLIRAVLEGVAYHKRWMLEAIEKKVPQQETLRFVGGGAQSDQWAQILADVTQRSIEVVANPQNVGALGAAITAAVGLGLTNFDNAKTMIKVEKIFRPLPQNCEVYEPQFEIFKRLYHQNHKLYKALNELQGYE